MINPLRLAALLIALAVPAFAQGIRLRLLAFDPALSVKNAFIHDPAAPAEDSPAPVETNIKEYLNHQAVLVPLKGNKLVVTTSADRSSMSNKETLIGQATIPKGVRSAILLFLPGAPDDKARNSVLVIDDSKRAFPPGSFRISNLSPLPVRLELEKKAFNFKPGETHVIEDPPVRENQHSGMTAHAFKDNQWRRIGSGLWPHPGSSRAVQILFQNPVSGQVQMRAFDDVVPRDLPPPEAAQR
jgi:hypothetical protein